MSPWRLFESLHATTRAVSFRFSSQTSRTVSRERTSWWSLSPTGRHARSSGLTPMPSAGHTMSYLGHFARGYGCKRILCEHESGAIKPSWVEGGATLKCAFSVAPAGCPSGRWLPQEIGGRLRNERSSITHWKRCSYFGFLEILECLGKWLWWTR